MASNKLTKQNLVSYIQEQVTNLYKLQTLKEQREEINKDLKILEEGKKKKSEYSEKAKEVISAKLSKMADEKMPQDQKVAIAINTAKEKGLKVPEKPKNESTEREHDPKAAVRNRGEVVFPAESSKVKDDKDHFPINSKAQARNAISRGNQFSEAPEWYKGSAQDLVNAIIKAVKKKYPDMEISKEAKKKKMNESVKVGRDTLMNMLKKKYPKAWFKPGEDFGSDYSKDTIWTGEGSYANDGMKLFDPYTDDYENYELEVYKPFNDFIEEMGYYVESYDTGTFFILPG